MAERTESAEAKSESLIEKITEKIHGHGDSSSSSSDSASEQVKPESPSSVKTKIFRLFGRERPVHQDFGGGKRKDLSLFLSFFFFLIQNPPATSIVIFFLNPKSSHHLCSYLLLHAQALTLAALAGAAVVEYYDHRTGKKADQEEEGKPSTSPSHRVSSIFKSIYLFSDFLV
ncbi:hypothetical protein CsatA_000007 [Cannabis sativa]